MAFHPEMNMGQERKESLEIVGSIWSKAISEGKLQFFLRSILFYCIKE